MLSYMVPGAEEKPPRSGEARPRRTIIKTQSRGTMSHESSDGSISSVLSEVPPTHDKPKAKLNGAPAKHPTLKRVSFGSSKGSMVETLIYESPLQEEPEPAENSDSCEKASKVKVSFYECDRPEKVSSPEPQPELALLDATPTDMTDFARQTSTESGWDNPFRPDGDLSREADEIVELIKGGKPITPTSASPPPASAPPPPQPPANGAIANGSGSPRTTEVKHATAQPPAQPEHVTIKKKPKSKCCSIQ